MMEITESNLSTSLQEAFTCYLAFLNHSQKLRESKLPRQGKGVETTADVSTQQHYQIRVAASETCLQYTGRIARRVYRWHNDPEEPGNDDSANVEVDVETLRTFLDEAPEFVDPFSGKWIQTNACSAGSHPTNDKAAMKEVEDLTGSQVQQEQRPPLQRQQPYRKIAHDYLEKKSRTRRSRTSLLHSQPSLGLHPNLPISPPSPVPTIQYRTSSERSSRSSIKYPPTPASSISDHEDDKTSITSDMATSFYSQPRWEYRDKEYAKQIEAEEKRRKEQVEKSYAEARRLADRMAREEKTRIQKQEQYARDLERQEREWADRMRRDREAAEKTQARWVMETTAREAKAKQRSEDQRRREQEEAAEKAASERRQKRHEEREKRHKEEREQKHEERKQSVDNEKKVRFGRERSSTDRIKRRSPSVSEERRRREAQTIAEDHRKKKEVEKKPKESKSKQVDCVSCMEPGNKKEMAVLPCDHAYCSECITGAFKSALKSHTPFKCCSTTISTANLTAHLSNSFIQKYNLLLLELSTKKPTYCSSPTCSKFIPPSSIHGPIATCTSCRTRTCVACTKQEHSGVCKEDKDGKKVEELAKKKGWKQCPKCSQILERTEGCLHMTCRCRAEWCYACLRDWDTCRSTCGRDGTGGGGLGVDFMGAGDDGGRLFDVGALRGNEDAWRRVVERNLEQRNQRNAAGRQERPGMGILPAVAMGLMMAMFED
ncbi:uncharacterized protein PAC_09092 [Phialocephala subalpina]|uniref:RBR-type E3 ubiquitin transferase n=1 Tax=Phialocephala subalpina TaxID=576137 RepID=A0A1L7X2F4_9HELO|nr:uncharacterized protein PAC_09092 [Phialocephala subalpina]